MLSLSDLPDHARVALPFLASGSNGRECPKVHPSLIRPVGASRTAWGMSSLRVSVFDPLRWCRAAGSRGEGGMPEKFLRCPTRAGESAAQPGDGLAQSPHGTPPGSGTRFPGSIIRDRSPPGRASGRWGWNILPGHGSSRCGPAAPACWRERRAYASPPSGRPSAVSP